MEFGELLIIMTSIILGAATVLIPIIALTARYVLKPMMESWAALGQPPIVDERLRMMERRVSLLEEQVERVEKENSRLLEEADFQRKLRG
jgi:hypothetical protein